MIRILQLTDLHVLKGADTRLKGIPTRALLQDVVRHVTDSGLQFDHVIVTGDHTHDELPESYAAVREILNPWIDRLWQVPGNHDDRIVMRSVFGDRITGTGQELINFSFEAGTWLCLGLDTHVPHSVPGLIDGDQVDWVRLQLAASKASFAALFFHHPPVDVGSLWMDPIGLTGKELLQDLFRLEFRIRIVCCGHVHHEFRCLLGNTEIVTTPSTAIQFSPEGSSLNVVAAPPGYRIIELSDDGYATRVVRLPEIRFTPTA